MKTIVMAASAWLLGVVILANIAYAVRPRTVQAASISPEARIQALEARVTVQQEWIDSHTSALQYEPDVKAFRPGDDISVSDSRAMSQIIPRSFWRR